MMTINPLVLLSILLLSCMAAHSQSSPVLDTKGNALQKGMYYYILPVFRGTGGGLTLGNPIENDTYCPLDVVQDPLEVEIGLPLTFSPINPNESVIQLSTDLNIKFSASVQTSTVWSIYGPEGQYFVTTCAVEGNPNPGNLGNWFKIEKSDDDYKLVSCPGYCNYCIPVCGDLGIYIDESKTRRLSVTDAQFKVKFVKA